MKPSDVTTGSPERGKVHVNREGLTGFKVGREENKIIENSREKDNSVRRIKTAKRVEKMGGIEYF